MLTEICEPNTSKSHCSGSKSLGQGKSDGGKLAESKLRRTNDCILRTLYTFWEAVYKRMSLGLYVVREAVYEVAKHGYS